MPHLWGHAGTDCVGRGLTRGARALGISVLLVALVVVKVSAHDPMEDYQPTQDKPAQVQSTTDFRNK